MIFLPEGLKTFNISEDQLTHLVPLHNLYIYKNDLQFFLHFLRIFLQNSLFGGGRRKSQHCSQV